MNLLFRLRLARLLGFIRPEPRRVRLSPEEILASPAALDVVQRFNKLQYESGVGGALNWRGLPMLKNPCDLWMTVELLQKVRPSVLLETGTHHGASALFFAEISNLLNFPVRVVTIDINPKWHIDPTEHGIASIVGYSTDKFVAAKAKRTIEAILHEKPGPVMVILDSDHTEAVVTEELETYAPLVSVGSYLIVEDTNLNGHPVESDFGAGPWEAVEKFLRAHREFLRDTDCERFLLTTCPGGWLRRQG